MLGKGGKYRQGTLDMHGSKDVVDLVEKTPCAIGYSGLAYATDHLKIGLHIQEDRRTTAYRRASRPPATAATPLPVRCSCTPTVNPRVRSRSTWTGS